MIFRRCRMLVAVVGLLFLGTQVLAENLLARPADMSPLAETSVLLSLAHAGERLVAVGERGFVLVSDDNGKTWEQVQVPVSVMLTGVYFATPERGWIIGHGGVILGSQDSGQSWQVNLDGNQAADLELKAATAENIEEDRRANRRLREAEYLVKSGPDKPFLDMHFFDEMRGIVVGAYGLAFETEDGGQNWRSIMGLVPNYMGMHLYSIQAMGEAIYIAGEQGVFFKSTDNGKSFEEIETPYPGTFFGIQIGAEGALVLYGLRGNALRSMDGGENWDYVEMDEPITLTASTQLSNGNLLMLTEAAGVLQSVDNGAHFSPLSIENPFLFTDVQEANDGALVFSGFRGTKRVELHQPAGNR